MNVTVQSGQGRLHAALVQSDGVFLAHCGSRITRARAVMPMDWALLSPGDVPVCRYCQAIADAVHFQQLLAREAAADAFLDGATGAYRTGRNAQIPGAPVIPDVAA